MGARVELLAYLLMPFFQGIVGAAMVGAVILALTGVASFWHGGPTWLLIVFYVLAFGGTILGCIAGRASRGARGWIAGFLLGHVYALYTWILWPVLARSLGRQLISRQAWSKTQREPVTTTMDPTSL